MSLGDFGTADGILEGLRVASVIGMLGGAAILDLKHRRVPNRYWIPFVVLAALGLAVDLWLHRGVGLQRVLVDDAVAAGACAFFYALWRFGMFGGADAKGLMVVALLMPRMPDGGLPVPAALGTLALGSVFAALLPLFLLAWNAAQGRLRMPTALVGVWMPVAKARNAKVWPMEEPIPPQTDTPATLTPREAAPDAAAGKTAMVVPAATDVAPGPVAFRIRHDMRLRTDRQQRSEARFAALEAAGRSHAWFAPQVPLVAFLLPGAIAWLWMRDVLAVFALG